ncbi:MAG: DUF4920 domain-containing protein [Myxococcales bacterium]|nr:DUF4920 domain-containing protein [Myxococcales bacterium]
MFAISLLTMTLGCSVSSEPAPQQEAVAPAVPVAAAQVDWTHYGAPFAVSEPVAAATVLADPAAHAEAPVRVRGELTEVCQKAGCWAVLRDDEGRSMRVTMKAHSFGIDTDSRGHECDAEGQLVRKAVDPARIEHFKSEGSRTNPEEGKDEVWELVATAVSTRPGG